MNDEKIQHVSDTAFWVATYRALETEREDALFRDPAAALLTGERGQRLARSMRATAKYSSWSVIIRTVLIDELLLQLIREGCTTVINLGAGLDTRPYRLDLPPEIRWVEVDFPDVIALKEERLRDQAPRCRLERIAADLSDASARRALLARLASGGQRAVVLTEGVIPYLTEELVTELARDLSSHPAFRYWIGEYYAPELYPRFQAASFRKKLGGAPFRFYPKDWFSVFEACGWRRREMRYLYDVGEKVGRRFPLPGPFALLRRFFEPKSLAPKLRMQAYLVWEQATPSTPPPAAPDSARTSG
jgi:methyltransferase (TIGR00027 family)